MEGGINFQNKRNSRADKKDALPFYSRHTARIVSILPFLLLFCQACQETEKQTAPAVEYRDSIAVMQTQDVTTLISDSGIIKYRIVTKSWDVYDRTEVPKWTFEKGLYLEQFDRDYTIIATIKSDTAYYYTQQKLWELRGNVEIKKVQGDKFFTSLLFWDQNTERVYSHKKIRIEQSDKIINGQGFESNQDMTKYTIYNTEGHVTFEEEKLQRPVASDSIQTSSDSIRTPSLSGRTPSDTIPIHTDTLQTPR